MSRRVVFEAPGRAAGEAVLRVVEGDLTGETAEVLVNAANSHLAHGGGVAAALSRKGGPIVQEESDRWVARHGPVPTGAAAVTGAGRLGARWIVHAVGPVWGTGGEVELLASAVRSALTLAAGLAARSLSMPALSTGIFGFPLPLAASTIAAAVDAWRAENRGGPLGEINLVALPGEVPAALAEAVRRQTTAPPPAGGAEREAGRAQ